MNQAGAFVTLTTSMMSHMRARAKEQYLTVPFTVADLREWLKAQAVSSVLALGGQPVAWQCTYCPRVIVIEELQLDHKIPLSCGGGADLTNLCCSCKLCNQTKGEFDQADYRTLMGTAKLLSPAGEAYLLKCLRGAGIGQRLRGFHSGKNKRAALAAEVR